MNAPAPAPRRLARPAAALLAALLLLSPPAGATWSILIVDTATGEVAVGAATCLKNFNLKTALPVVVVGRGAAVAQSLVDVGAVNRMKIWDGLHAGLPPDAILALALAGDNQAGARQYGIIDMTGAIAQYTGQNAQPAKLGVQGSDGTLFVAVQGNVLTGHAVAWQARAAVLNTPGSVADKLMAGMEAAYALGGDGRCSCQTFNPTGCGVPPASFTKTAHVGFMIVARAGDADGVCVNGPGCASGSYYMTLEVKDQNWSHPDPVLQLREQYDAFRLDQAGRPDGVLTRAVLDADEVLGDGQSVRVLRLELRDVDDAPIAHGGHEVSVTHAPDSAGLAHIGAVKDHGDGTYTVELLAGAGTGHDRFTVRIAEPKTVPGAVTATVFPPPVLEHVEALRASAKAIALSRPADVVLELVGPSSRAGRPYVVALSLHGTAPGQLLDGTPVPLNADRIFAASLPPDPIALLRNTPGLLDDTARGVAAITADPALLAPLAGVELHVAWFTWRPVDFASNALSVVVLP